MTQTHLTNDPAVVCALSGTRPLSERPPGEPACLRYLDVYDSCEMRGGTELCLVGKATFEGGKGLHTFEMKFSTIESLMLSISITLRGYCTLFYGWTTKA
jgi:hypothetical protein